MFSFFRRQRTHEDFSEEIQAHLELESERLTAEGMSPETARAAAIKAFGNVAIVKERFFETSRWARLEQFLQDLRYACRGMRHSPSFVLTTVVTLAVGLGLLTIAFTIFNAYVLRPFAIRDPDGLHQLVWHARDAGGQGFRWSDYDELSRNTELFSAVIGEHTRIVSSNGQPIMTAVVSLNYFDALGPSMQVGRGLAAMDANEGGNPAVLTDQAWTRLFDREPSVLGRDIELNGRHFTIVGVLARAFTGLDGFPQDVFVPVTSWIPPQRDRSSETRETEIFVRLQPGVTRAQAETALEPFMARTIERQDHVTAEVRPQPSPNKLSAELLAVLSPVFAAFLLVLVTACANVSNVMLARAIARHREIAVRLSIGASRGRIIRQLLTEGLVVAVLAGIAGLALAACGLRVATVVLFATLPPSVAPLLRIVPMTFDARVFLFAFAASALATLLFALLPALQASRLSLTDALRGHGGAAHRGSRLRSALVIGQVAVALVLVITAMTIARNAATLDGLNLGFDPDGVTSINVRGNHDEMVRALADILATDPRVSEIAVSSGNPLFNQVTLVAAGPAGSATTMPLRCTFVSPEFFPILKVPTTEGRGFRVDEAQSAAHVAIVSDGTAKAFWPGESPIGKTIRIERANGRPLDELPDYPEVTVIGTVPNIVSGLLITGHEPNHIYLPVTASNLHAKAILFRGRTDREPSAAAMQELFRRVTPDPMFELLPLGEMRDFQMYPLVAASWVGWLLGAIALVLSVSGLYGVLAYALSQRTKEIGIRMALGATARAVVALVIRQSVRLAAFGTLIGAAIALIALQLLNSAIHLETISLVDVGAFAAGSILVVAATILAAYQPARRATRIDPARTLRADG